VAIALQKIRSRGVAETVFRAHSLNFERSAARNPEMFDGKGETGLVSTIANADSAFLRPREQALVIPSILTGLRFFSHDHLPPVDEMNSTVPDR
jgi:hypothetical protein